MICSCLLKQVRDRLTVLNNPSVTLTYVDWQHDTRFFNFTRKHEGCKNLMTVPKGFYVVSKVFRIVSRCFLLPKLKESISKSWLYNILVFR